MTGKRNTTKQTVEELPKKLVAAQFLGNTKLFS